MHVTRLAALRKPPRIVVAAMTAIFGLLVLLTPVASAQASAGAVDRAKPTVVLEHGAWADASSWNGVIPILQHEGYTVYAPPNPLRNRTARGRHC
jgi:hypothetical protein